MDPFELLKKDHKTVSDLFKRIESASGKAKLNVFRQLKRELDLHAHIEEVILYPALEKAKETRDLTLEAYEEHKVVKDLLGQMAGAKTPSDEWQAKLTVLRENVEHHVDEEEGELFDKANDVLTSDEAEKLGNRMQAEKIKQGGSAVTTEKPGLIQTIATALGLGGSSSKASKKASKASKKAGKAAGKSSGAKSSGPAVTAKKKTGAVKPGRGSAARSRSASGKSAGPRPGAAKRPAAKKSASKSTATRASAKKARQRR